MSAAELKAAGNALFGQQKWKEAHAKYSAAIALDANAVLYANRAACATNLKRYQEALADAKKATELDPAYAKGWARLATAQNRLQQYDACVASWQHALAAVPQTEQKQRQMYEAELNAAKTARPVVVKASDAGDMPWARAARLKPALAARVQAGDLSAAASSAWVIHAAYENFEEGMGYLKMLKRIPAPGTPKGYAIMGHTDALTCLSNAIMRDQRVFHIRDSNFVQMYNDQVEFEATKWGAWVNDEPDDIMDAAQARLRTKGWDAVRPALSTTVRCWILRAHIQGAVTNSPAMPVRVYGKALQLLERGRAVWRGVPAAQRGTVFERTFVVGVRALHLEAYMKACTQPDGASYAIDELLAEAEEQLVEIAAHPIEPGTEVDPGFVSSFVTYPTAQANSMLGYYYKHLAQYGPDKDVRSLTGHYAKSGEYYLKAAHDLPRDDEQHAWFLSCAANSLWKCAAPLKTTLPVLRALRDSIAQYTPIWEHSAMGKQGRDQILQRFLDFEEEATKGMEQGKFTLDSQIHPDWALQT